MRSLLLIVMVLGLVGSAAVAQDRRGIRFWNLTLYTDKTYGESAAEIPLAGYRSTAAILPSSGDGSICCTPE
jgi:hypothetical protein